MSKYHNKHTEQDGYSFDSLAESRRYWELKALERAGEISGLVVHPRFVILPAFERDGVKIRKIEYVGDFQYEDHGTLIVEDVKGGNLKGTRTEAYRIKRKMFLAKYPEYKFVEVTA